MVTVKDLNSVGVDAAYTLAAVQADELQCMVNAEALLEQIGSTFARDHLSIAAGR